MLTKQTNRDIWKWIRGIFTVFLVLYLLAFFVFRISPVQTKTVDQLEKVLSKSMGTKLQIGKVNLRFFDFFQLKDVYIEGTQNDTFLYVSNAFIDFDLSLRNLANGEIRIEALNLKDGHVTIRQLLDGCTNVEFKDKSQEIADSSDRKKKGLQFVFDPSRAQLQNITYTNEKLIRGTREIVHVDKAKLWLKNSDFSKYFEFEKVMINGAEVTINKFSRILSDTIPHCPKRPKIAIEKPPLTILADKLLVKNGTFHIENELVDSLLIEDALATYIDFNHFTLNEMDIEVNALKVVQDSVEFQTFAVDGRTTDGFVLENMSSDQGFVKPNGMTFKNFVLETPLSQLKDQLEFQYNGYGQLSDFVNKVFMNCNLDEAELAISDLLTVAPRLYQNKIFVDFKDDYIRFDGSIKGTVNNMIAKQFNASIGNLFQAQGNLSMRSITNKEEAYLNLDLTHASAKASDIKTYFPKPNWPVGFQDLGLIQFDGRFIGLLTDWVATCTLQSNLGSGEFDIHVNTLKEYFEGDVALYGFQLGQFFGHANLGEISARLDVENGNGFSIDRLDAKLNGEVSCFEYKGYSYENAYVNGQFKNQFFDGRAVVADSSMNLVVAGRINISDDNPQLSFESQVNRIDLQALNLSNRPIMLKGDFDFDIRGKGLDELNGKIALDQFVVNSGDNGSVQGDLDSLIFEIKSDSSYNKHIRLESEPIKANIHGKIEIVQIANLFKTAVYETNPNFYETIGFKKPKDSLKFITPNDFVFDFDLTEAQPFLRALAPNIDSISGWIGKGYFKNDSLGIPELSIETELQYLKYEKYDIDNGELNIGIGEDLISRFDYVSSEAHIGSTSFDQPKLSYVLVDDNLDLAVDIVDFNNTMGNFDLYSNIRFIDTAVFVASIDSSSFNSLGSHWSLEHNSEIRKAPKSLFVDQFVYSSDESNIYIQSVTDYSLIAGTRNLDAQFVNEFINNQNLEIGGQIYANLSVENLFDTSGYEIDVSVDNLKVNDDIYDRMGVNAYLLDISKPAVVSGELSKDGEKRLDLNGSIDFANVGGPKYDLKLDLKELPLSTSEIFLGNLVNDTRGVMTSALTFTGVGSQYDIDGGILINGHSTFTLLGTELHFDDQLVKFTKSKIDFNDLEVSDGLGNLVQLDGELRHHSFQDANIQLSAKSGDIFRVLNTRKNARAPFYGLAYGKIDLDIQGPLDAINVNVDAESRAGTKVVIPITYYTPSGREFFYTVLDSTSIGLETNFYDQQTNFNPSGVDVRVNLKVNTDAQVEMIFGDNADDIIKGNGNGDMAIHLDRSGELRMFGHYDIVSGSYNFAKLRDFGIIRPLTIQEGGSVEWSGDPINAEIGLVASYELRTSPFNFVSDLITTDLLAEEARNVTDVELRMSLVGALSQPDIDFDFGFPLITGQLRNLVNQKKSLLENDPAAVNEQAYSLLVSETFAPPNSVANIGTSATNTVSDIVTSIGISFINELIAKSNFFNWPITNLTIDFDAKSISEEISASGESADFLNYFEGSVIIELWNDINITSRISRDNRFNDEGRDGIEIVSEYYLEESKNWRLRAGLVPTRYQSLSQIQRKLEAGVTFTKQYDRLGDIFKSKREKKKDKKSELP